MFFYRMDYLKAEVLAKKLVEEDREKWRHEYPIIVAHLAYGEYVAKLVSKKTGIKVNYLLPGYFYVLFDSTGLQ